MKIGIVLYSQTGHTLSVAQKLQEALLKKEHSVSIERITLVGGVKSRDGKFQIETSPDISPYDAIIFGAPVEAFSLSPVMKQYLTQMGSLKGKKIACLVTQFFPFPWLGGKKAVDKAKSICESKDASLSGSAIVNWSSAHREKQIVDGVKKLSQLF